MKGETGPEGKTNYLRELKGIEGIGLLKKRSLEKISKVSSKFCFAKAIYDATLENRSLEIKVT